MRANCLQVEEEGGGVGAYDDKRVDDFSLCFVVGLGQALATEHLQPPPKKNT